MTGRLSSDSFQKASSFIRSTRIPDAESWIRGLERGSADAAATLLVSLLPNLRSLFIGPGFSRQCSFLGKLLMYILYRPPHLRPRPLLPAFEQLSHVSLCHLRKAQTRHSPMHVLPFFYLPNIRNLSVCIDSPSRFVWSTRAPDPSSLTSLELSRLKEGLEPLLGVLSRLQSLCWIWPFHVYTDQNPDAARDVLDLGVLRHASETLRKLAIGVEPITIGDRSGDLHMIQPKIRGSISGLANLSQLTVLCLPWALLMGFGPSQDIRFEERLPRQLENLKLSASMIDCEGWEWDTNDVIDALRSGLEIQKRPFWPRLRLIGLFLRENAKNREYLELRDLDLTEETGKELVVIGARVGVTIRIPRQDTEPQR
ncbi:hypothetical protein CDD83_5658 [Cordyceps sp. RAO-2017]|nr:hypothetical protein CDD83_5658 [Cordyceps sp. RAO-2017]